jgi:hypothetical protein
VGLSGEAKRGGREWVEVVCAPEELPEGAQTAFVPRWQVMRRWAKRATLAFLLLTAVSVGSAYLGYHAGAKSDRNTRSEAQRAVFRSCADRADLRLTVAVGFDELRRSAIAPGQTTEARLGAFLTRTQEPIDRLLGEAAGHVVKTEPEQVVNDRVLDPIRDDATATCQRQASRFNPDEPPG